MKYIQGNHLNSHFHVLFIILIQQENIKLIIFIGAVSGEACQSCLPGYYCAEAGLSSPSGACNPGFYCTGGSRTATPWGNNTGDMLILLALFYTIRKCSSGPPVAYFSDGIC